MPYIKQEAREKFHNGGVIENAGELNFVITKFINDYINRTGGVRYAKLNEVIGVLECAKMELYRRIAAPYEDEKITENGDVYGKLI